MFCFVAEEINFLVSGGQMFWDDKIALLVLCWFVWVCRRA